MLGYITILSITFLERHRQKNVSRGENRMMRMRDPTWLAPSKRFLNI